MRNSVKIVLIVIILVVIGGVFYLKRNELSPAVSPSASSSVTLSASFSPTPTPISDMIQVTKPIENDLIDPSKPLAIEGKARGSWYFEASFPAKLIDASGNVLAQAPVMASGSWMTTDFVPFTKQLQFTMPTTLTGTLILHNDNPSGLPANDRELRIPVRFNVPTTTVHVYFENSDKNPGALDCTKVFPVTRTVAKTSEVARASLLELLKGPTQDEKAATYATAINNGVQIKSLTIANGIAKVDFDQTLQQNIGGSCRVAAIRAQITQTLKQFPTVKSVIISIDGKTEGILQP